MVKINDMKLYLIMLSAVFFLFMDAMHMRCHRQITSTGDYSNALLSTIVPLERVFYIDPDLYKEVDRVCHDSSSLLKPGVAHSFEQLRLLIDRALPEIYIEDRFLRILVQLVDIEEDIGVTVLQLLTLSEQEWVVLEWYYQLSVVHDLVGIQRLYATPLMLGLSDTCWAVLLKIIISQHDEISLSSVIEYGAVSHFTLLRSCAMAYKTNQLTTARQLLEASVRLPLKPLSIGASFVVDERWLQKEQQELGRVLGLSA